MPRTKCVSYLRVSSLGQVDEGGFDRQRAAIARRAKSMKLDVVAEYRDEGVSGTKPLAERPGLRDLLARILSNGVRVILIEKADRLARDLIESELILRELREREVRVVECEGGNDLTTGDSSPTATLVRQVLGAFSEFDKANLVARMRAGREKVRRETGWCEGTHPYGDLPGEQEVVAIIKRLRRKNPKTGKVRGYGEIADELARLGKQARSGKPWNRSTVRSVLMRLAGSK